MIPDGYDKQLDGVVFRPLPRLERVRLLRRIQRSDTPLFDIVSAATDRLEEHQDEDWVMKHWSTLLGLDMDEQDKADEENLRVGVWLDAMFPQVARRPCTDCKKWWYDHDTGRIAERGGRKLLRPAHTKLPCETTGCIKGDPDNLRTLSPKNQMAYEHYLKCRATCSFPDDPIVTRNAVIIRDVEDQILVERLTNGNQRPDERNRLVSRPAAGGGSSFQPGTGPFRAFVEGRIGGVGSPGADGDRAGQSGPDSTE